MYFLSNFLKNKSLNKKFLLDFSKNDFSCKNEIILFNYNYVFLKNFFVQTNFKKLIYIVSNLFFLNKNILLVDVFNNYNYLPLDNKLLFSRSFKKLSKLISYYNIYAIFYINLKKKKFVFKKLFNNNVINISLSKNLISKKFDLNINISENKIYMYLLYVYILKLYLKIKNN